MISPNCLLKKNKSINNNKEILFETTYEKVLYIINKVKDFIKSMTSSESKLIEELDWVIKVITNKSLYNYELIKETLMKQDEEYNKYINFIKKYNEEVIQMNKKHRLVNSILNIRKKEEVLLKPSLFLKKNENINEGEIKQKKKNFVNTFGNYILNLYYKKEKNNINDNNKVNNNKEENINNNMNDNINEKESQANSDNNRQEESKKNLSHNNNKLNIITIPNHKKVMFENNKTQPKENLDKIINVNIQRIQISNKKMNIKSKSNIKLLNLNLQEITRKKYRELTKLSRAEKVNFNQIKNIMRDYYLNQAYNDPFISNSRPILFKNDFNNIKQNNREKPYYIYKTKRSVNTKNKYNTKNNKVILSLPTTTDNNEKIFEKYNKNNIRTEHKSYENKNNLIKNDIKIENTNNNNNSTERNIINNNFEIKVKKGNLTIPLDSLIYDYINEVKSITSFDFNIFELKKKVGYNNVLPLMGYTILKTLGLVDNKIISTKKLESFLRSVSDNYKETTLYHNSLHGADVTQSLMVYFLNSNAEEICETTVLDLLGMIISAMGHDLGHPGFNNGYHINASTELGITYNDKSCLENFHTSYLFRIIRKEENNILEKFSVENYKTIRKRMISQIIATDMAYHGENISSIRAKIRTRQDQERFIFLSGNDKTKFDEQQLLLNYLIHMADLGHNCKKFEISKIWIKLLCEEFWKQGDKEREKGLSISFMCDRNNIDVPASQIGFLKGFILSSFDCLVEMFPKLQFTIDNANDNIKQWTKFKNENNLLGWTPKKEKEENEEKK